MSAPQSVTAIVVALGDDPRVADCLTALRAELPDAELIVVENGAEGDGPDLPMEPTLRLRRGANPGFAGGVNEAIDAGSGEYILTLNPDASLHPGAVTRAFEAMADPTVGAVAFRLERPDGETLDSAGIRLGLVRRARDRGFGGPSEGRFTEPEDVDAACMACALFRRRALDAARDGAGEVLDSRFFAYKEDVDLGWRLRRAGFRVRYEPGAVATHERGWREGARAAVPVNLRVLSFRNRWWTILKNESPLSLVLRMALYIPVEAVLFVRFCLIEPGVLRAYPRIVGGLRETLRRRKLKPSRLPT